MIEIGAGRGALTLPLLERTQRLCAVEVDEYLAAKLAARLGSAAEVLATDFLEIALPSHAYRVIGNIPFAITTEIVRKLAQAPNPPEDAWLVMQREPAWRLCGRPYLPDTLWSLRLKPLWHLEIVERLSPNDFDPPPKVDSVMLWMCRRGRPLLAGKEALVYGDVIASVYSAATASAQRALRPWLSKVQLRRLARDLRFDPDGAVTALVFEQWLGIARFLARRG